jgi:hypothetical protein
MKILYLLKQDYDDTLMEFVAAHRRFHEVNVIDLRDNKNFLRQIELIESSDMIIAW